MITSELPYREGRIRVYRNASLSIATSLTHLSFDTVSTKLASALFDLTSGNIVPQVSGRVSLSVNVVVPGALLLASLRLKVTTDPSGTPVTQFDATDSRVVGNQQIVSCTVDFDIVAGIPIKAECAIAGLASTNVGTGDTQTYARAWLIS